MVDLDKDYAEISNKINNSEFQPYNEFPMI